MVESEIERRHIPSAATALFFGGILGLIQAVFLIFGAKPILNFMGVKSVSMLLHEKKKKKGRCSLYNRLDLD